MANIHSLLPLLADDSWRWDREELVDEQLPAGRTKNLLKDPLYPGFLYYGLVSVRGEDGEKAEVEIDIDTYNQKTTIEEGYLLGSTRPGGAAPGITRYDTENNIYAIVYQPSPPLAYLDNIEISISAPSRSGVVVNSSALKLDILDLDRIKSSYQDATLGEFRNTISGLAEELGRTNDILEELAAQREAIGESVI